MRRILPILAVLATAAASAPAQQQEKGLTARLNTAPDMALVNPMQNQAYGSGHFATKAFGAGNYGGVKSAPIKTFETRSSLGIKNPWFGPRVFDATTNHLANREAKESREKFKTESYAVREFAKGGKEDLRDTTTILPTATQPRPYLVAGKTQAGVDRFTQNLQKDLTIDDVRDLLNKGHGE